MSSSSLLLWLGVASSLLLLQWAAFRRPPLALGLLLALLPLLALTRRLFPENALFFPSIETIAVVFVWGCVQVRSLKHGAPRDNSSWPINVALFVFLMTGLISSVLSRDPDLSLRILVAGGLAPILCYSLASRYLKTDEDVQ